MIIRILMIIKNNKGTTTTKKKSKNNSNKSVGNKAQAFLAIKFVLMHICK